MDRDMFAMLESLNCVLASKVPKVQKAIEVIDQAVKQYGDDLWFSFNSGKDNTACFFLTGAVLYRNSLYKNSAFTMKCVYFEEEDPFVECEEYMDHIRRLFKFDPLTMKNTENLAKYQFMKHQMKKVVHEKNLKAIIMGSRRTDPYCGNLQYFSKSSVEDGWPEFTRVSPILDWDFKEVWQFFNQCKIPYCNLYDKGYTYLGDRQDTVPNPFLRTKNGWYLPASAANSNYEPFSRKSIIKNLQTNETGKILITENNVRNLVLRVEYDMSPDEIRKEFLSNLKSFEICQNIMNESHENIKFNIDFVKAIKFASTQVHRDNIQTLRDQEEVLTDYLNSYIAQLSQQLRIPLYILFLDMVRKNCVIFG